MPPDDFLLILAAAWFFFMYGTVRTLAISNWNLRPPLVESKAPGPTPTV